MSQNRYIHTTDVHNTSAAEAVVPYLLKHQTVNSVIDVGCGTGTWLKVFQRQGVKTIKGIDGFHLNPEVLVVPKEAIELKDLEKPFEVDTKYDLAICLEVAEHLKPESASDFVKSLTKLSDKIIFSAALPGQGGQNHLNEQWPSYWKALFQENGFEMIDCLRGNFWNDERVDWWYRQNMFLVIKKGTIHQFPMINTPIDIVHPAIFTPRSNDYIAITRGKAGIVRGFQIFLKNITRAFRN